MATEQQRADMSKQRGQVAAGIKDSDERKKFIARQGNEEAKGKQDMEGLGTDAFRQRNVNVAGSFKHGGTVPATGIYKLHKNEKVIPAPVMTDPSHSYQSNLRNKADVLDKAGDKSNKSSQFRAQAAAQDQYESHGPNGNMVKKGSAARGAHDKD